MFRDTVGGHAVQVDVVSEPDDGSWTVFEVPVGGFATGELVMHWGVGLSHHAEWTAPTENHARTQPPGSPVQGAVQTCFPEADGEGVRKIPLEVRPDSAVQGFQFVLHRRPNEWLKGSAHNFIVDLARLRRTRHYRQLVSAAEAAEEHSRVSRWSCHGLDLAMLVSTATGTSNDDIVAGGRVFVAAPDNASATQGLVLQYGLASDDRRWHSSTRVTLEKDEGDVCIGSFEVTGNAGHKYLLFVLHDTVSDRWLKHLIDGHRDFEVELPPPQQALPAAPAGASSAAPAETDVVVAAAVVVPAVRTFPAAVPVALVVDPEPVPEVAVATQPAEKTLKQELLEKAAEQETRGSAVAVASWDKVAGGADIEVGVLAISTAAACTVWVVAKSRDDLLLHYGSAGADRKWPSASRASLESKGDEEISADGRRRIEAKITIPGEEVEKNLWIKDGSGRDFELALPRHEAWEEQRREYMAKKAARLALAMRVQTDFLAARSERRAAADVSYAAIDFPDGCGFLDVACSSTESGTQARVDISAWIHPRLGRCVLHFGALTSPRSGKWTSALDFTDVCWPSGTTAVDERACQAPLQPLPDGLQGVSFTMPAGQILDRTGEHLVEPLLPGLAFVLKSEGGEWLKPDDGGDAVVRLSQRGRWKGFCEDVANKIISQETMSHSMSLKRRYDNCLDLVNAWEKRQDVSANGTYMMRRLPSWNSLVRVDSRQRAWSRNPSMPLDNLEQEQDVNTIKEEFWSWIFVWQRFSFMRLLTWEQNTCTQPRMLAGTTNAITHRMAELWKAHPQCRMWARWTLATMGRGGNAGQQIRDQILVIMHAHDIKEIHGTYYEQWHQKLHNNTTPEDIGICRAIIAFLSSGGNMGDYWRVLADHGITRERLASYSRPITTEPYMVHTDVGRLIGDFQHYLHILRSVHDALDLQYALDHARGCLPGSLQGKLQDICNFGGTGFGNYDEGHGKFVRIADARQEMLAMLNHKDTEPHVIKELLVLDFALETQQSVLIQGMASEERLPLLCDQLKILLTALVGHLPIEDELQAILADWTSFSHDCAALSWNDPIESALLLKAMCDRISRVVGELSDKCQQLMGPKAEFLGEAIGAPRQNLDTFVDEVLRGTSLMAVSLVLQRLEPKLREIAQLPPWQIISSVSEPVQGEFRLIDKIVNMQDQVFETPTVLLSGAVSGEEEIPAGVVGVLVRSAREAPDVLSHCAVRARNFGVLLATCFDPAVSAELASKFEGKWVEVTCKVDGTLSIRQTVRQSSEADMKRAEDSNRIPMQQSGKPMRMNLNKSGGCSWVVRPDQMTKANVGSKSLNLALLRPKLPEGILTPQAVALPYGSFQKALSDASNKDKVLPELQKVLSGLLPTTSNDTAAEIFTEAQRLIHAMKMPKDFEDAVAKVMADVGRREGEARLASLFRSRDGWRAIKSVWSSLFAIRPWVSLAKAGRSFHDLNMAVLVQELVEAKYAFVLHTVNPFTHDKDELYGELVAGRGEVLVGNYPGRSLSFVARRGEEPRLVSFPSKSVALHTQHCLIFRSDSNGEDLDGFAGAGLFESVCAEQDKGGFLRLHRLPVVTDRAYRQGLLRRITALGWAIEEAFGGAPQDIEGCIDVNDRAFVVQSRPQV
eukprot:TRINITY_DN14252_c0_g2_i3.p1 TRINITY_DN14252_c0_g2~~TRINITY_DN14252_c0_g2_i3.p1  ORF type:complete len:1625 (+),score=390.00 TRINITY_DN14252_c0_g2_i3:87-4961(+)